MEHCTKNSEDAEVLDTLLLSTTMVLTPKTCGWFHNQYLMPLPMIHLLTGDADQKPSLIVHLGHTGLGSIELSRDVLHRAEQKVAKSLEHGRFGGQRADCVGILRESCLGICLGRDTGSTVTNADGLLWRVVKNQHSALLASFAFQALVGGRNLGRVDKF